MNKPAWLGIAIGVTLVAIRWGSKRTLSAEGDVEKESILDRIISGFRGDKEEVVEVVEKRQVYDYGSIELPEPVVGLSGKAFGQSSLEPSVAPISSIGQNSSGRIIGGY